MKTIIYSVLFLCFCIQAHAKVARVLYYNKLQTAPSPIYLYVKDQLLAKVDATLEFGEELELKASDEAIQIVFSPHLIAAGQELPAGLPSISVNQDWAKFLIIVVEAQGNELLPIKPIAVNAEDDYFGKGDFLLINRSPNSIVGTFGEEQIEVAPEGLHVAKMAGFSGKLLDVKLDYVRPNDNGKKRWMIYQGWRVLPDRKTLVFCYVPKGRATMKYFATQIKGM